MENQNSKKYLVTGGAGFIGTNLVKKLVAEGNKVIVVDDLRAGNKDRLPREAIFHQVNICDIKKLIEIAKDVDAIVHLAALPRVQFSIDHPVEAHEVNVNGTLSVLEAARAAGVKRVVFAASSAAYGDQELLPLKEDSPTDPKSPYGLHKLIGEQLMQVWSEVYGIETVSLRFFNVYGPHLDPDGPYALVIGRFLKLATEGKPLTITGDGTQTRDFIHVFDVIAAIEKAALSNEVGKGEVLNVGAGSQTTINDLARMISDNVEYIAPRVEPKHTLADISKTTELLNWEPIISMEEGIAGLKKEWNIS